MNKYERYKKTELSWIEYLPLSWDIKRVASIFGMRKEKNFPSKTKEILSLSAKHGVSLYSNKKEKGGNKPKEDLTAYNLCYPGDILVNCMNVVAGSVGISNYFGAVSPVYYPLVNMNEKITCTRYMEYIFRNYNFQRSLVGLGKGIQMSETEDGRLYTVRMRISWDMLKTQLLPIPPIKEQIQIANYLDWKINEINRLIKIEKEKRETIRYTFINKLKNTYSTLDDCENISLKRVCKVFSGKEVEDEVKYSENAIPVFGSGNSVFKYTNNKMFDGEYIIFGRKGTIGKPYKLDGKFWLVDTAYAAKNNKIVTLDYLFYIFRILNWEYFTTNTVKPSIVANQVLQTKIKVPCMEKQNSIMLSINSFEKTIDSLLNIISNKINQLEELKKSLIAEVVTGQIDVRDIVIPEYEKVTIIDEEIEEFDEVGSEEDGN